MRQYFTYLQLLENSIQSRVGYNVDEFSRKLTSEILSKLGCQDIKFTTGNDSTDITATYNGNKISVECKDRSYKYESTTFNDHFIEKIKLQSLYNRKQKGEFDKLWLASLFRDGVIAFSTDLEHNIKEQRQMLCPLTTTLGNTEEVLKDCVFYNQDVKIYFCFYFEDGNTSKYNLYFQDFPIDMNKLNQEANKPVFFDLNF